MNAEDSLRALAEAEARRTLGDARVRADPARLAAGWERRFVADAARAEEAMAVYAALGYEVCADPVRPEDLEEGCDACPLATLFKTVYTRRKGGL